MRIGSANRDQERRGSGGGTRRGWRDQERRGIGGRTRRVVVMEGDQETGGTGGRIRRRKVMEGVARKVRQWYED